MPLSHGMGDARLDPAPAPRRLRRQLRRPRLHATSATSWTATTNTPSACSSCTSRTTTFNALFNVHQRTTTGSARLFRANLIKKGTQRHRRRVSTWTRSSSNAQNFQNLKTNGANARLSWDLGAVKLYSITGYEHVNRYLQPRRHRRRHAGRPGLHPVPGRDRQAASPASSSTRRNCASNRRTPAR